MTILEEVELPLSPRTWTWVRMMIRTNLGGLLHCRAAVLPSIPWTVNLVNSAQKTKLSIDGIYHFQTTGVSISISFNSQDTPRHPQMNAGSRQVQVDLSSHHRPNPTLDNPLTESVPLFTLSSTFESMTSPDPVPQCHHSHSTTPANSLNGAPTPARRPSGNRPGSKDRPGGSHTTSSVHNQRTPCQ